MEITVDDKRQKTEWLVVKLSKEDKIRLKAKAEEQNLTISSYVRTTLLNNKDE